MGEKERVAWSLAQTGPSGKLPGVYQSYFLVRPAPSMRIIFVSPALRKVGNLLQKRFMDHISAPSKTMTGLDESFAAGVPVTAKVAFAHDPAAFQHLRTKPKRDMISRIRGRDIDDEPEARPGRTCWLSATPMRGSDDRVGVWIVVMIEKKGITSTQIVSAPSRTSSRPATSHAATPTTARKEKSSADTTMAPMPLTRERQTQKATKSQGIGMSLPRYSESTEDLRGRRKQPQVRAMDMPAAIDGTTQEDYAMPERPKRPQQMAVPKQYKSQEELVRSARAVEIGPDAKSGSANLEDTSPVTKVAPTTPNLAPFPTPRSNTYTNGGHPPTNHSNGPTANSYANSPPLNNHVNGPPRPNNHVNGFFSNTSFTNIPPSTSHPDHERSDSD